MLSTCCMVDRTVANLMRQRHDSLGIASTLQQRGFVMVDELDWLSASAAASRATKGDRMSDSEHTDEGDPTGLVQGPVKPRHRTPDTTDGMTTMTVVRPVQAATKAARNGRRLVRLNARFIALLSALLLVYVTLLAAISSAGADLDSNAWRALMAVVAVASFITARAELRR